MLKNYRYCFLVFLKIERGGVAFGFIKKTNYPKEMRVTKVNYMSGVLNHHHSIKQISKQYPL